VELVGVFINRAWAFACVSVVVPDRVVGPANVGLDDDANEVAPVNEDAPEKVVAPEKVEAPVIEAVFILVIKPMLVVVPMFTTSEFRLMVEFGV
jgi:hypothetical protein